MIRTRKLKLTNATDKVVRSTDSQVGDQIVLDQSAVTILKRRGIFVALFSLLFAIFLLIKPVNGGAFSAIDNVLQFSGPMVTLPWVFWGLRSRLKRYKEDPAAAVYIRRRTRCAVLLGLTAITYILGQIVWTINENILHIRAEFSFADLFFMFCPPLQLAATLVLPARPIPTAARTRVVLDGLTIMTGAITFTWYFILGPLVLDTAAPIAAKVMGTFYPLQQLLTVYCILQLSARSTEPVMRSAVKLLYGAMVCVLITQSIYGYLLIHNAYKTGSVLDAGWPLGLMLLCLAAGALRFGTEATVRRGGVLEEKEALPVGQSAIRNLLPYAIVPIMGAFIIFLAGFEHNKHLMAGVYIGAGILVALTLLRQSFAFIENARLYGRLHEAYDTLAESNNRVVEHAASLKRINAELKALQNELVQSAKLASVGTLATGVAHELNQPLAIIRGIVQQIKYDESLSEDARDDLKLVESQTSRMMKIIQHLRSFARVGRDDRKPVDVNEVIEDCFIIIGAQLQSKGIEVKLNLADPAPIITGDQNELEQVLINLLANAQDAVEETKPALITITTFILDANCRIEIADNGPGVPDDIAAQIFDPFFTTKDPGKGTGLGLSISHSIIRKHHGTIQVENRGGAVFTIVLPAAGEDSKDNSHPSPAASAEYLNPEPESLDDAA